MSQADDRFRYDSYEGLYFKQTSIIPRSHPILMLPHSRTWEAIVIISIILHVKFICITFTYYSTFEKNQIYYMLQYTLDLMYAQYLIFTFIHRSYSIHKDDYCSQKMPFLHLLIGTITAVPHYFIFDNIIMREKYQLINQIIQLKVIFRLCHVVLFFARKRSECGSDRRVVIIFETFAFILVYICMVSCIISLLGCYNCDWNNWTTHQKDDFFDYENFGQRMMHPMVFIGGLILGNYNGVLIPETIAELTVVLITMMVGLVVKINFLVAPLISEYVNLYWKSSMFKMRMNKIHTLMWFEHLEKSLQTEVVEYFNTLWNKRSGISHHDANFYELLPLSLRREITLDLGWDALIHSHFFRNESLPVKSTVADLMRGRFMLKGDVIYESGDMKSTLIYIVSGIVQLLSDEDDESPVLSFSSGTVISEFSCLMIGKSACRLQCATYCEMRVLHLPDFYRGMNYYKSSVRKFQKQLRARINSARMLIRGKSIDPFGDFFSSRPIRRVKMQWNNILHGRPLIAAFHTSKYMDLIALTTEQDLKVEVVCLTSKFPLIMDPNSSFREFCEMVVLIACLIETAIIPFSAAFTRELSPFSLGLLVLLDIVYILDIYFQVTTAIVKNDIVYVKFTAILLYRVQEISFLIDVIASLPIDYLFYMQGCSPRWFIMLKIPRILKIYKLIKIARKFQKNMSDANSILVLFMKYFILWIISAYLFTCLFYLTSCYTSECFPFCKFKFSLRLIYYFGLIVAWYPYNKELSEKTSTVIYPMMSSLMFVINILSEGHKDNYPYTYVDTFLCLLLILFVFYLLPFITAEITVNYYWKMREESRHKSITFAILKYGHLNRLKHVLTSRIVDLLEFRWKHNQGLIYRSPTELYSELPQKLDARVREAVIGEWLDKQVLFETLNEQVRKRIVHTAQVIYYHKGAKIIQADELVECIYIVKRGICKVTSKAPGDAERKTQHTTYSSGASFPVVEVIHKVPTFLSVEAATAVDCILIPFGPFKEIIKYDIPYCSAFLSALELHKQTFQITLTRAQYSQDDTPPKRIIVANHFKYEIDDNIEVEPKKTTLFKRTINPHSKIYIVYEICRCILAVFQFLLITMHLNLLYEYRFTVNTLIIACDLLSWIDIFIRIRLHYYQADGILVTDFKAVAKYYMRHSFAIDFYASCPFSTLSVDTMISPTHPVLVRHYLLVLSRPLHLYRVFIGISCACNRTKIIAKIHTVRILCILLVFVILAIAADFIVLSTCVVNFQSITCPINGWTGGEIEEIRPPTTLAHYLYIAAMYLHGSSYNAYSPPSNYSYTMNVIYTIVFLSIGWILITKIVSLDLHGLFMTSMIQNIRTTFQSFAKFEGINPQLTERLLEVNAFRTRDTDRHTLEEVFKIMPPSLHRETSFSLYYPALTKSRLFMGISKFHLRNFAYHFKKRQYMKDDIIIRNNDINKYIFIVNSGSVAITLAGYELAMLVRGGMFGCLSDQTMFRQTIDARAKMHTEVIYIETSLLNGYIYDIGEIKSRMARYIQHQVEYVENMAANVEEISLASSMGSNPHGRATDNVFKQFNKNYKRFRVYNYLLNVHLPVLSTMFVLIYQMVAINGNLNIQFYVLLYILDCFFILKILLGFLLPYVDQTSGLIITHSPKIALRYLRNEFALDFIGVLMPELCFGILIESQFHNALLTSNRLLRIIYLFQYYRTCSKEHRLTHTLRWLFLAYVTLIYIQVFTNIWYFVACTLHECRYRKFVSHDPESYQPMESMAHSFLYSYTHVVNYFTGNGLSATKPLNVDEIVVNLFLVVSSIFMLNTLSGRYAFVHFIDNYYLGYYKNQLRDVKTHLTTLRVSPSILEKVVRYYDFIWKTQRGVQTPSLIPDSRRYLCEDIMLDLYSEVLMKSDVFKNAHMDFFRQLVVHIKRVVYCRAMIIVQQDEVDGKMYFIQIGKVKYIYVSETGDMDTVGLLSSGQSFGEEQGLMVVPHEYTFIAETKVVVLTLEKREWAYLLRFFPATYNNIRQYLNERQVTGYKDF